MGSSVRSRSTCWMRRSREGGARDWLCVGTGMLVPCGTPLPVRRFASHPHGTTESWNDLDRSATEVRGLGLSSWSNHMARQSTSAVLAVALLTGCSEPIPGNPGSYALYANPVTAIMVWSGSFDGQRKASPSPQTATSPTAPTETARPIPFPDQRRAEYYGLTWTDYGIRKALCLPYWGEFVSIMSLKKHGAPIEDAMAYVERKSASDAIGADPLTAADDEKLLLRLVGAVYYGEDIYDKQPGGFTQYVFDLCMRGKLF